MRRRLRLSCAAPEALTRVLPRAATLGAPLLCHTARRGERRGRIADGCATGVCGYHSRSLANYCGLASAVARSTANAHGGSARLGMPLAVELVRRHRPRRRPPPPPTHRWGAGIRRTSRERELASEFDMPLRRAVAEDLPGKGREGPSHRPYVCHWRWSWCGGGIALGVAPFLLRPTAGGRGVRGASRKCRLASEFAMPLRRGRWRPLARWGRRSAGRRGRALREIARPRVLFMAGLPLLARDSVDVRR